MEDDTVSYLKKTVEEVQSDPSILSEPKLSFLRDYLECLGCELPPSAYEPAEEKSTFDEEEIKIVESDVELEREIMEPDNDPPQKMGDSSVEVSEENSEAAQEVKWKAMEAISEGKFEEAIEHLTQSILLKPRSSILYATRANVYAKLKKPNAAIRDANVALQINPDSAKGYKSRGIARTMLGQWEEAAKDLHTASNIDYDEEISAILKKVEPNAHKIVEHRRKYDRLRKEREDIKTAHERHRRKAEARAAYKEAKKKEQASSSGGSGGMPGGMPGFPGSMSGGFGGRPDGRSGTFRGIPPGWAGGLSGGFGGMPGAQPSDMPSSMPGVFPQPHMRGGFPQPCMPEGFPQPPMPEGFPQPRMPEGFPRPGGMPVGMSGSFGGMPGAQPGGVPGGFGGAQPGGTSGGMPGNMSGCMPREMPGNVDVNKILNDPELMASFKDPEIMSSLQDVMNNPANLEKHRANPKVAAVIAELTSKFAGPT